MNREEVLTSLQTNIDLYNRISYKICVLKRLTYLTFVLTLFLNSLVLFNLPQKHNLESIYGEGLKLCSSESIATEELEKLIQIAELNEFELVSFDDAKQGANFTISKVQSLVSKQTYFEYVNEIGLSRYSLPQKTAPPAELA